MRSPSEAQIKFVEEICRALDIDFPTCSKEFTAQTYYYFIVDHIDKYQEVRNADPAFEDELSWDSPLDIWGNG